MPGTIFLLSVFPSLEGNMLPPVGHCNINQKLKLFSITECSLRALVLNNSPCVNTGYGNHPIPGCHSSGFISPQAEHLAAHCSLCCPPIFVGHTLDKGIGMAL